MKVYQEIQQIPGRFSYCRDEKRRQVVLHRYVPYEKWTWTVCRQNRFGNLFPRFADESTLCLAVFRMGRPSPQRGIHFSAVLHVVPCAANDLDDLISFHDVANPPIPGSGAWAENAMR